MSIKENLGSAPLEPGFEGNPDSDTEADYIRDYPDSATVYLRPAQETVIYVGQTGSKDVMVDLQEEKVAELDLIPDKKLRKRHQGFEQILIALGSKKISTFGELFAILEAGEDVGYWEDSLNILQKNGFVVINRYTKDLFLKSVVIAQPEKIIAKPNLSYVTLRVLESLYSQDRSPRLLRLIEAKRRATDRAVRRENVPSGGVIFEGLKPPIKEQKVDKEFPQENNKEMKFTEIPGLYSATYHTKIFAALDVRVKVLLADSKVSSYATTVEQFDGKVEDLVNKAVTEATKLTPKNIQDIQNDLLGNGYLQKTDIGYLLTMKASPLLSAYKKERNSQASKKQQMNGDIDL